MNAGITSTGNNSLALHLWEDPHTKAAPGCRCNGNARLRAYMIARLLNNSPDVLDTAAQSDECCAILQSYARNLALPLQQQEHVCVTPHAGKGNSKVASEETTGNTNLASQGTHST